jgi:hypothetical protein
MDEDARNSELAALDPLIGEWTSEATHPMRPSTVVEGRMTYEWLEGERFLIQRRARTIPTSPTQSA